MLITVIILFVIMSLLHIYRSLSGMNETDRWGVYQDKNGLKRLRKTLRPVIYSRTEDGYYVIKDLKHNKVLTNITKETAKWSKHQSKKNGRSVYVIMSNRNNSAKIINPLLIGNRYEDIETGEKYVIRKYSKMGIECWFYMNMTTYKFVRPTDFYLRDRTPYQLSIINSHSEYLKKVRELEVNDFFKSNSLNEYSYNILLNNQKNLLYEEELLDNRIFNLEEMRK